MDTITMDIVTWADPITICLRQENLHAKELTKQPTKLHLKGIQKKNATYKVSFIQVVKNLANFIEKNHLPYFLRHECQ